MTIHWILFSPNDFYEERLRSVIIATRPVVRMNKELGSGMTPEILKPNVPPPPPVVGDPSPPGIFGQKNLKDTSEIELRIFFSTIGQLG